MGIPAQGCALVEPGGPWRPTFALGRLENLRFFLQNHMPGTLGFTVSEHWAPFNFRYSAALPRFGHPHSQNASDITGDAHITVTAPSAAVLENEKTLGTTMILRLSSMISYQLLDNQKT